MFKINFEGSSYTTSDVSAELMVMRCGGRGMEVVPVKSWESLVGMSLHPLGEPCRFVVLPTSEQPREN